MEKIKECYNIIKSLIENDTKYKVEPFESITLVEEYRRYWKPEKTRVVLLAESHVFTKLEDMGITLHDHDIERLSGYPSKYAKFVYCLGYGEPDLTNNVIYTKRDGTWQFWKIFYSCVNPVKSNEDFKPILKVTAYKERLKNKIDLLQKLKQNGIWLVDASIVALYDRKNKPSTKEMRKIIKVSWDNYTKSVVKNTKADTVICIGKGVYDVLEEDLKNIFNKVYFIKQPQARLSSLEQFQNYQKYGEYCRYG
jgi:hypothetical protein